MFCSTKRCLTRILFILLAAALAAVFASCGRGDNRPEHAEFTEDEIYLIDAYVKVKRAEVNYLNRQEVAESLFTRLDSTIDASRIANTIQTINQTPERWNDVFQEIESSLRKTTKDKKLEETRRRP